MCAAIVITVLKPYPTELYKNQFHNVGFTDDINTLTITDLKINLKSNLGDEFVQTHFPTSKSPADIANTFEMLLEYGTLKKKTIQDEYASTKFRQIIQNIKNGNVDFTELAKHYGIKACETVFKEGFTVTYGKYPTDFPFLTPGHHQIHPNAEKVAGIPVIHLQKKRNVPGAQFYDSFDVMYFSNQKTHLFSDVLEGHLCRAAPGPEQYVAGEPGCWWIQPVNLFIANKQQVTRLDTDKILQVPYISMAFSP